MIPLLVENVPCYFHTALQMLTSQNKCVNESRYINHLQKKYGKYQTALIYVIIRT